MTDIKPGDLVEVREFHFDHDSFGLGADRDPVPVREVWITGTVCFVQSNSIIVSYPNHTYASLPRGQAVWRKAPEVVCGDQA